MKGHIVLLGDSIFDNQAYVEPGGATIDELRARLPTGWQATLLAVDGNVTSDVAGQLDNIPASATHLVISAGGDDALGQLSLLEELAGSVGEALYMLGVPVVQFERDYRAMLETVLKKGLPTIVCTVYNGNFPNAEQQLVTAMALTGFNDVIIRAAWAAGVEIIDLRIVCDKAEHYANSIEPSTEGSARIAEAILQSLEVHS